MQTTPTRTTLLELRRPQSLADRLDARVARRLQARAAALAAERGHKMAVFANDLIGIDINLFGVYEREALEVLFAFLAPLRETFERGVALDIGANIGNHTLFFAPRFAAVHAFEPNPDTFELLAFNTRRAAHVKAHALGLGSEAARLDLMEHATNLGGSSLRIAPGERATVVPIEVRRLDDLGLDLDGLCFVKIDVEGFEAEALRGARATIERHQPLIVLEQHASEFHDGQTAATALLQSLGYRFAWHHTEPLPRTWLGRRLADLRDAWRGRTHRVVTGAAVEPRNHSMLIAMPPRFQPMLAGHGAG